MASTMRFDNWQTTDGTSIATTNASGDITFAGAVAGAGKILQVVTATYSTQTSTTSGTYVDTPLTATITPSAATSKVMVLASVPCNQGKNDSNTGSGVFAVERGGSQIAEGFLRYDVNGGSTAGRGIYGQMALMVLDSPATTSATVYTWQMKTSGTAYSFYDNLIGTLTLMEVSA